MNMWSTKPSVYNLEPTTRMAIQIFENRNGIKLPQGYTNFYYIENEFLYDFILKVEVDKNEGIKGYDKIFKEFTN